MPTTFKFRGLIVWALLAGLLGCCGGDVYAQNGAAPIIRRSPRHSRVAGVSGAPVRGQFQSPAPIERRAPPLSRSMYGPAGSPRGNRTRDGRIGRGEHLPEWMRQHDGLTLQQQQQALEREPGFRELPPQTQERMLQRLALLHAMPPLEQQRMLAHTEAMERLTLEQRSQVRGAMAQLGSLPPDQRRQVAQSFRELRLVPPDQRMEVMLYSGRYSWLNEAQRTTLVHLIQVAPMLPQE